MYKHWQKPEDLRPERLAQMRHFFEHCKDLKPANGQGHWGGLGPQGRAENMASVARSRDVKPKPDVPARQTGPSLRQSKRLIALVDIYVSHRLRGHGTLRGVTLLRIP
jgi:hypothetical protein